MEAVILRKDKRTADRKGMEGLRKKISDPWIKEGNEWEVRVLR